MRLVHLRYLFRIPKYVPPMRWFTSGTSFVYPNMYTLCVWFTSDSSRIPLVYLFRKYVPPYAFGSPQVSFTSFVYPNMYPLCTPFRMRLVHLRFLSYTQICTPLCVWFNSGTSFVHPNMYPHMRLVHPMNLFRIPKYVPPMRLVHLRYLSYTQICTPYAFRSPQVRLSYTQICTP